MKLTGMNLPSLPEIRYIEIQDLYIIIFHTVRASFDVDPVYNPLPDYRREDDGSLSKCLELVRNDDYYPDFLSKAAYLFISINKNHFFSNGNKRLAYVVLWYFLHINRLAYSSVAGGKSLKDLAFYVADRQRNKDASFDELKQYMEDQLSMALVEEDGALSGKSTEISA